MGRPGHRRAAVRIPHRARTRRCLRRRRRLVRTSHEECVEQILNDCDWALVYLPAANRDWLGQTTSRCRGRALAPLRPPRREGAEGHDLPAMGLRRSTPENDPKAGRMAAKYAAEVMDFKLTQDGAHGFDPTAAFAWTDPNSPEIIWSSDYSKGSTLENLFLPRRVPRDGQRGTDPESGRCLPGGQRIPDRPSESRIITRTGPTPTAIPVLQRHIL